MGESVITLIIILLWPLFSVVILLELNAKNMLPGTANYKRDQIEREAEMNASRARHAAIEARLLNREDEYLTQRLIEAK